jgi:predicted GIY-YIG superfamily endonuclease
VKTYYVYVLRCFDGTFYVGMTSDIEQRVAQHHCGIFATCYTYTRRPLILVHVSDFRSVDQAIAAEKKLKGWSHRKKRAFVESNWSDLKRFARSCDTTS